MKIENTAENKAKFFALYLRQKVMRTDQTTLILCDPLAIGHGDWYLELIPLSQITDEDAEFVIGSIECQMRQSDINNGCYGMSPSGIFIDSLMGHNSYHLGYREVDYLRLKGYAVKWVNISVEKQIEYGWIKLKNNI